MTTRTKPEPQSSNPATITFPLATSTISAGFPSPADDFVEDNIDLNEFLIKHPAATFFVRVTGNSMVNANIHSGDLLIVDRAVEPYNNAIVIAILDGEFTVKRIKKSPDSKDVYLHPENGLFQPVKITEAMDFEVWGVVIYVIHPANL